MSKCRDRSLKPVLVSLLRDLIDGDSGELFQAMIALEDIGEPIFESAPSQSVDQVNTNRLLARKYLQR